MSPVMLEIPDSPLRLRLRVALKAMMALAVLTVVAISVRFLGGPGAAPADRVRVDVRDLPPGAVRTVGWQGRPVLVLHRSAATVAALGDALAEAPSPQWFVTRAVGTASGCTIVWQVDIQRFRESCSSARWDAAGQPADGTDASPLDVPPYQVVDRAELVIGR